MFRQVTKFGRRLRSRGTPNHDNSQSSQEITPLDTPSGSAPPDSLILSTGVDKDFFPSCISPVIQMPVPRPATPDARDAVDELASVAQQVQAGPPAGSYTERALDKQGDKFDDAAAEGNMVDVHETVQALKSGIDTFMEDIQWFIKALDDVAKLHPFVAAPILAFKAVYSMEKTRRENDKRIISLYVAMKDMIAVLVQLRHVKDPTHVGPDGATIGARMQSLADQAAEDIKDCANACDTYSKKKLLVKVLKGPVWEGRLAEFIGRFARRRSDFKFALAIHTATVADSMQATVGGIDERVAELTDMLRAVFTEFKPQDEASLAAKVEEKGGTDYVQGNDTILRELLAYENTIVLANHNATSKVDATSAFTEQLSNAEQYAKLRPDISERSVQRSSLRELKSDLGEDWKTAVDSNMKVFQRKFTIHKRQLQKELSYVIHEENERVIQKLSAGPHDRIQNEELKEVWQEMGWRRNVEANLFVTTLRDHFREKLDVCGHFPQEAGYSLQLDDWALEYIDIRYLQQLKEALDEDGSGYITISEVNRFANSQPQNLGWSLQQWIAYWTIGWQVSATRYRDQIRRLFAEMFAMRSKILPENRYLVDNYLQEVWAPGVKLIESLQPARNIPSHIRIKFRSYVKYEEERIAKNLDGIKYNIDALDTVYVVTGPGRLENHIFPLLYLLLKRDVELFRVARNKVFGRDDLFNTAMLNMRWVYDAVASRHRELYMLFKHKGLDVESQMKSFACELFEFHHDPSPLWKSIPVQTKLDQEAIEAIPDRDMETSAFDFDIQESCQDFQSPYEIPLGSPADADADALFINSIILGEWNGFVYSAVQYPIFLMTSFYARVSTSNDAEFEAYGAHYGATYQLAGRCIKNEHGTVSINFTIHYSQEFRTKYYSGYLTEDGSIIGSQGWNEDSSTHQYRFILKRTPAEVMCHRPSPLEFQVNQPRALWKFAIRAIRHQLRKQFWSWSFFAKRRETRLRQIQFDIRNYTPFGRPLDPEERAEWAWRRRNMTATDASFYRNIRDTQLRIVPGHPGIVCDACRYRIGGARIVCLDCLPSDGDYCHTVDFCDDPICLGAIITPDMRSYLPSSHVPTHDFFKVRTVLHFRDLPAMDSNARRALVASKRCFEDTQSIEDNERIYFNGGSAIDNRAMILKTPRSDKKSIAECRVVVPDDCSEVDPPKFFMENLDTESSLASGSVGLGGKVTCAVCEISLERPCWFCMDCFIQEERHVFICDHCEAKTLLRCIQCSKPYRQPTWYYGTRFNDSFSCNKCTATTTQAVNPDKAQHTYLHALVRCLKTNEGRTCGQQPSADERTTVLEHTVGALSEEMHTLDNKLQELKTGLGRVEEMVRTVISKLNAGALDSLP